MIYSKYILINPIIFTGIVSLVTIFTSIYSYSQYKGLNCTLPGLRGNIKIIYIVKIIAFRMSYVKVWKYNTQKILTHLCSHFACIQCYKRQFNV